MNSPTPALVCFAVKEEAAHFRRLAGACVNLQLRLTGMGRQNAEEALSLALAEQRPRLVVTSGFAGALVPGLATGDVVFGAEPPAGLEGGLRAVGARPVRFHCAERVVTTAAEKRALHRETGAEVVEMESHYIQRICHQQGIPAATIRVILDTVEEDLVLDFNELMTPDQRIDARKLTWAVLKSPAKIPALMRFQKRTQLAAQRLGEALVRVLAG